MLIIVIYEQAAEKTSAIHVVYCSSEDSCLSIKTGTHTNTKRKWFNGYVICSASVYRLGTHCGKNVRA